MKTSVAKPLDGRVALTITAEANEVDDGISYLMTKLAQENGIDIQQSFDIEFDLRAKVGSDFLSSYLNTQVPLFLAARAVGNERLETVLDPELQGRVPRVEKGKALTFQASVIQKPRFELSSYEPVSIDVQTVTVSEEEIDAQLYMVAEGFATFATGEDGEPDPNQRIIPAVTDKWVEETIPGCHSVMELREKLRENGLRYKESEQREYINYKASAELAKRLEGTIPEDVFELTRNDLIVSLQRNLEVQGRTLDEFVKSQGGQAAFYAQSMVQTNNVLKQGFALDALARHLNMRLTAEDISLAFSNMAPGLEDIARADFERTGRMYVMEEAAMRIKATLWLVDHAIINYVEEEPEEEAIDYVGDESDS
ncbi:MAG: hypothetical protein FWH40_04010 [Coriobacteriia bacterium]|nr:hypothetical protein [Coriobacteriia bacterium]MCL2136672.1 hypothetical protein [Coriobacteriia bacterium]